LVSLLCKKEWQSGNWAFQAGVEASAGSATTEGSSDSDPGFTMHVLAEGGASATATVKAIRVQVNNELSEDL
jgi:hypothetical protein